MSSQITLAAFSGLNNSTMIHMWHPQWGWTANVLTICAASSASGSCPQNFPKKYLNVLRIENNLRSWHDIMVSISWMLWYIIYKLINSGSYCLTTN